VTRSFQLQLETPHPTADVWRALTDPKPMALWLMNFDQTEGEVDVTFTPRAGAPFRLDAKPKGWRGHVLGTVLEAEPPVRLAYTWAHSARQDAHPVRVEFRLEPTAVGTRVTVTQTGFPGVRGWLSMQGARLGWRKMLTQGLPAVLALAHGPGRPDGL